MEDNKIQEIIDEFSRRFIEVCPNGNTKLINEYEIHLRNLIEAILSSSKPNMKKDEETIKSLLESDLKFIKSCTEKEIEDILIKDKHYEDIRKCSGELFSLARKVVMGQNIEQAEIDELNKRLSTLEYSTTQVRNHNKDRAEKLYSEAIADLHYIEHPQTEVTSLRLGRFISYYKKYMRERKNHERD